MRKLQILLSKSPSHLEGVQHPFGLEGMDSMKDVAKSLVANSYIVDSSVTPFVSWTNHKGIPGGKGGPDFIDSTSASPYKYSFPGGTITEIPITIMPTRFPSNGEQYAGSLLFQKCK